MWPFLTSGLRAAPAGTRPEVGSVVAYRRGQSCFAHRVVGTYEGGVFTRSDRPGARVERVPSEDILGVWEKGAGLRSVFLRPSVGSVVAKAGLALSRPPALALLKSAWRRLPRAPLVRLDLQVHRGEPGGLVTALAEAGLNPGVSSLEELEMRFLTDDGGFVVPARSLGRVVGAAVLREVGPPARRSGGTARKPERARRGLLTMSVRRAGKASERLVLDELLAVTLDEASARGFGAVQAEALAEEESTILEAGLERDLERLRALRRHGFSRLDPAYKVVPATGHRLGLYRKLLG